MSTKKLLLVAVLLISLLGIFFAWRSWSSRDSDAARADLLSLLPTDGTAAGFLDLQQLRNSPFLAQVRSWAPRPTPDSDYAQFMQATGFDYERDLDRVALSINRQTQNLTVFAVAEGRFDRKKIEEYGSRFGSLKTADRKTLFAVPVGGSGRKAYFTFLRDDRLAWANDSSYFFQRPSNDSPQSWREHFSRVAGTPMFVVLRQDPFTASTLAQAPGGFRSPQLATLLGQLQWIAISGKPDGNQLRVVIDGESFAESTVRQLKDVLNGIIVLAQVGLNDAKTSKQFDPQLRQGYLDLLQSADIQQVDRGTSKSIRIVFEVTPRLLQAPPATDPHPAPTAPREK